MSTGIALLCLVVLVVVWLDGFFAGQKYYEEKEAELKQRLRIAEEEADRKRRLKIEKR